MTDNKIFVKDVNLKGYRSINDISVSFDKNLNIIIGKNSAGKTNFLTFLNKVVNLDYEGLNNFSSRLTLSCPPKELIINANKQLQNISNDIFGSQLELTVSEGSEEKKYSEASSFINHLSKIGTFFQSDLICHGIPKDYKIVDQPFSIKFEKDSIISFETFSLIKNKEESLFVKNLIFNIIYKIGFSAKSYYSDPIETVKELIKGELNFINQIKNTLKTYSPISDIRFSDNFNLYINEENETFLLDNLFLEFKINKDWLPFKFLSDGTKRTFYLISEIFNFDDQGINYCHSMFLIRNNNISKFFFIEEPELGIHPHQFKKILNYIREKSKDFQIFITTHSPQSLDILTEDELDKIIIAYSNDKNETVLRKLGESEKGKARKYIDEEFLSDYWLYSDLEN